MAARYRAPPVASLRIVPLDQLSAVYHRASGQTHVVAPPVPEILDLLADRAMTADELLAALAARYDLADGDTGGLVARLDELVDTGLVECVDQPA
ncbi:HPr-rel-A system PqqD family peptide chaperone [Sphingomonas sp. 2R-10]|uniref:HPr-rel-A system PqqD family peptide chaperone n=1 Tax=Sphingomonas sp. 2R-10 TaxID=3045148 RepID=UPI0019D022FA|nr:HPr-rel-A system PqqD family peptide chaperone [Sphingomonas sp. 2R-10]MDJ0276936.1 HPr-rel-A system PqqD family peptide chaperone [Sphingomonas sp. 2R-10]